MLKIIDTNYALRYLVQDDIKQATKAKEIINEGAYILPESLVETVYVLSKVYKAERKEIYFAILNLLNDIEMMEKAVYENASKIYGKTKLDFVDCILVARNKLFGDKIFTFDKVLNKKIKGVEYGKHIKNQN